MDEEDRTDAVGRWLTYQELADELGLSSRDAARKRIERDQARPPDEQQWEKRVDVQGVVYVRLKAERPDATDGEDAADAEPEWPSNQPVRLQPIVVEASAVESMQDGLKAVYAQLLAEKDVRINEWRMRALAAEKQLEEMKALPEPADDPPVQPARARRRWWAPWRA